MSTSITTGPRRPRRIPVWAAALVSSSARSVVITAVSLLLWAAVPATWGWTPTTVMSDSMAPSIRTGDVIVAMPIAEDAVAPGHDLLVRDPDHEGRLRFHRFVEYNETGQLILKGDANAQPDSSPVDRSDVVGVGVIRVPFIGLPVVWLRDAQLLPLLGLAGAAFFLFVFVHMDPTRRPTIRFRAPGTPAPERATIRPRRVLLGAAAAITAVAVATTGFVPVGAQPASAAFTAASPSPTSAMSAAAAYDCLTPTAPDSPFFYYRYAETAGTTVSDASGNARTGTLRGTTTRNAGSCVANATPSLTLDGSTGYVSTPSSVTATNVFSVEVWFKTTTASGGRLIGFGNAQTGASTNTDRHLYMTNAGKVAFGVAPSGNRTAITSPISYNDGAWHLAIATLSTSGMALYVDGSLVASNTAVTTARSATGFWRVGGDTLTGWANAPTSAYFAGSVDGTAAYTSALSAARISAHYTAGR